MTDVAFAWDDAAVPTEMRPGSAASTGSAGSPERLVTEPVSGHVDYDDAAVLDQVRDWLGRYVLTTTPADLDLLTLWAAHTWLCDETYSSPRLIIDSLVHGAGKTTVLDHLSRLTLRPVLAASLSSAALLSRLVAKERRTILIDEADRSLDPKREGVEELLAIINSGYRRGATRPVLTPVKGGGWEPQELSTYSPVAMAGNNPALPDDTRSRCIRVLLLPDIHGRVQESDWEVIEDDAKKLGMELCDWAERVSGLVRGIRPPLPDVVKGRFREKWLPLMRVATAAGGRWPQIVALLSEQDVIRVTQEREEGLVQQRPAVVLLQHMKEVWPEGTTFLATEELLRMLIAEHPEMWSERSDYGRQLTAQRMGRMLVQGANIHSDRLPGDSRSRGYRYSSLRQVFDQFEKSPQ